MLGQIFFQAEAAGGHRCGGVFADVAIMPGFVADAGDAGFAGRVALDEAVAPTIGGEPVVEGGVVGADVDSDAEFVFAGAGQGNPLQGEGAGGGVIVAAGAEGGDLVIEEGLLLPGGAITGVEPERIAGCFGIVEHVFERSCDAPVYRHAAHIFEGESVAIRKPVALVHQCEVPGLAAFSRGRRCS